MTTIGVHIKRIKLLMVAIVILLAIAALLNVYAWYANMAGLNTISLVQVPSKITISGSDRAEMTRINLELTDDDTKSGTTVTINRVFCIESTADFLLEVAHTTNIDNMTIKISPVSVANSEKKFDSKPEGYISASDGVGNVLYYKPDVTVLAGGYINRDDTTEIAIQSGETGSLHDENYSSGDSIQKNAEPLFWLGATAEDHDMTDYSRYAKAGDGVTSIYYRYYVLQLSWDSETLETDLVYLMACHSEVSS